MAKRLKMKKNTLFTCIEPSGNNIKNTSFKKSEMTYNRIGTTRGLGKHVNKGDPFSLTCEPIVDEKDKPLDGGDRFAWIKGVYNTVDSDAKNLFWLLLFVIFLIGILVSLHVFIFKNIVYSYQKMRLLQEGFLKVNRT